MAATILNLRADGLGIAVLLVARDARATWKQTCNLSHRTLGSEYPMMNAVSLSSKDELSAIAGAIDRLAEQVRHQALAVAALRGF